jgi:hypothetical protein
VTGALFACVLSTGALTACVNGAAQTMTLPVAETLLEDEIFQSLIDGVVDLTGCEIVKSNPDRWVTVYEQVLMFRVRGVRRPRIIAKFDCRGISSEMVFVNYYDGDWIPNRFLGFSDATLGYEDFYQVISSYEDVPAPAEFADLFLSHPIAEEVSEAISSIAPGECSWGIVGIRDRAVGVIDDAIVRDLSGVPSQRFDGSFDCDNPADRSCYPHYHFSGRYYPEKAYLLFMRIRLDVPCA